MNLHHKPFTAPAQSASDLAHAGEVAKGLAKDISEMDLSTRAAQEVAEVHLLEALHALRQARPLRPTWPPALESRGGVL